MPFSGAKGQCRAMLMLCALLSFPQIHAETFPADAGVINVTDSFFGAVPNDGLDDAPAIQKVFDLITPSAQIVYFPPGQYDLSREIYLRKTGFVSEAEALPFSGWTAVTAGGRTFLRAGNANVDPNLAGRVTFVFDAIKAERVLRLNMRTPDDFSNSFYFRVNGGAWRTSNVPVNGNTAWRDNAVVATDIKLNTGSNVLEIAARENDFELDLVNIEYLGNYLNNTIIEGASAATTTLKLLPNLLNADSTPFSGALIRWESGVEQFFRTAVRDLTFDVGDGNPNADGLKFHGNNQSIVANVRFLGLNGSGDVGLDLSHTAAIGPILVQNISVEGFAVGIHSAWQNASRTFDTISLRNQRVYGWVNEAASTVWINGLTSENAVMAFRNNTWRLPGDGQGRVALLNAQLTGTAGASAATAVQTLGQMYARNVQAPGYGQGILNLNQQPFRGYSGQSSIDGTSAEEWWSNGSYPGEGGGMTRLFDSPATATSQSPDTQLRLPIQATPATPITPLSTWDGPHLHVIETTPGVFSGIADDRVDDTASVQAAIDSGALTVYFPNGRWLINGNIELRGNVQRLLGTEAELGASDFVQRGKIIIGAVGPSPVFIERMANFGFAGHEPRFEHASNRTVVFNSVTGLNYRPTSANAGHVFINDTVGNAIEFRAGQKVWARQLNIEEDTTAAGASSSARLLNDGADVWILGFKTENAGVITKTINGGRTEVIGNLQLNGFGSTTPQYVVENAAMSVVINIKPYPEAGTTYGQIRETRGSETRTGWLSGAGYVGFSSAQLWSDRQEIILDNDDLRVRYLGLWQNSSSFPRGFIGNGFRYASAGANSAIFAPNLPSAGRYAVYVRWVADWGGQDHSNHASNAGVQVVHAFGTQNLSFNHQLSSDGWRLLGNYDFAAGPDAQVRVNASGANGKVIADAVRFVRLGDVNITAPEIAIEQPSTVTASNNSNRDFGGVASLSNSELSFTVRNWGTQSLTGISTTITGADAAQFSLQSLPPSSLAPGVSADFVIRFSPTSVGNQLASLQITSNDTDEGVYVINLRGAGVAQIAGMASGSISLPATGIGANRTTRVSFTQAFAGTPVVIVQADDNDADPQALRISNVSATGFDVLQVEAPGCVGCTGAASSMTVHWLAAMPGSYRIPDQTTRVSLRQQPSSRAPGAGVLVQVGTIATRANQRATSLGGFTNWLAPSWQEVIFQTTAGLAFSTSPVVLSQIQTWNPANEGSNLTTGSTPTLTGASQLWLTTSVRNVSSTGFDTALESSSADDNSSIAAGVLAEESIGYIAIESGVSTQLTSPGTASVIGLTTNIATSSGSCTLQTSNFPAGTAVTAANLRAFAGLMSRNEDDGGWLRRCALQNPSGTEVSLGLRVDEDADLSTDRNHPSSESVGAAVLSGDFTTTPVTLSYLRVDRDQDRLQVQFESATEAGHLGYRIWGRVDGQSAWQPLHTDLIVNDGGDSMTPKAYQRTLAALASTEIRIEDVDLQGVSRFHSPLLLGDQSSAEFGARANIQRIDWQAVRASNAAVSVRNLRGANSTSNAVLAAVRSLGIQRIRYEDLRAAGFADNARVEDIAVINGDQPVARFIECATMSGQFGPGCSIEWLGTSRPSLYGSERIYLITTDASRARNVGVGAIVAGGTSPRTMQSELDFSPNRQYSFSAPGNDPWFDERLVATGGAVALTRSFRLPARVAGPIELSVKLWGGLDFTGADNSAPDHSVEIWLNAQRVGNARFDGLNEHIINLTLDASQVSHDNILTIRLPADTGYVADVVLLDGYQVRYQRRSDVSANALAFGEFSNRSSDVLMQDAFETRAGFAVNGINGESVIWSQTSTQTWRDAASQPVALDQRIEALMIRPSSASLRPSLRAAPPALADYSAADYLIITHPLFEAELQPLIALQISRGYRVRVLRTDQIYAAKSDHQRSPQAIREVIAQINPRFVLLVGGDSYDYDDNLALGSESYLPTFYRASDAIVRFAASDALYADADGDGMTERALGRIPARTVAELRAAIGAITARGNTLPAQYFASAGRSAPGENFATHSRSLLSYLRQGQATSFALSDEIGLGPAQSQTLAALSGGTDWINYLGHSSPSRWARETLLDITQLASIQRIGMPKIITQWGCWNSYFVMPGQNSMSQALLLADRPLAAAVIGSTNLAEDASHMALGLRFFDLLEDGVLGDSVAMPVQTLGEILQAAKRDLLLRAPEHRESLFSISLFGDPAMPVR